MSLEDLNALPDSVFNSLLNQGVSLGFFHSCCSTSLKIEQDDVEAYRQIQRAVPMRHTSDMDCQLIFCEKAGTYYTREGLRDAIVDELDRVGGRTSKTHIYQTLNVDPLFLEPGSPILELLSASSIQAIDTDVVSEGFWVKLQRQVSREVKEKGVVSLVKFANQHGVTMDTFLTKVVSKLECETLIEGSQELASNEYVEKLRDSLVQHFQSLVEPVMVAKVCAELSCNVRLALDWLTEETKKGNIKGEVHVDTESLAMFTPSVYTNLQIGEVTEFLEGNGYITKARASRHGLSLSKIEQLARENHEDVLLLDDVLIIENIVLQKVRVAAHLCVETGIVDLGEYLPACLIRRDIVMELLRRASVSSGREVPVISDGRAILVSEQFHNEVYGSVVLPLIQIFAKTRAEDIIKEKRVEETKEDENETTSHSDKKSKYKLRRRKEKHADNYHNGHVVVPLQQIAQKINDAYPAAPMVDVTIGEIDFGSGGLSWEGDDDCGVLLIEFCKSVLYTDTFREQCDSALRAELTRLESAEMSKARISRKEVATKLRNVDTAFEDSFTCLCHLIQASSKFFLFASANEDLFDDVIVKEMQNELLLGFCADLTSRITQYCLYKNEEEPLFTFSSRKEEVQVEDQAPRSNLPSFCEEVDQSGMEPIQCYLSCPPPRDPLPVLRECLDGSKGVTLARQWILCGGESYRGGVRTTEEGGKAYVREGSIDGFLNHVQENCLTLCGLPFKKLEKKTEKQLLFRRKIMLVTLLQETMDPATVLDLTIMLLFQQVKHLIVYGKHLRGAILNSLLKEKKMSGSGCAVLLEDLKKKIENGSLITEDYLNAVKGCGLCKDIGKHVINFLVE